MDCFNLNSSNCPGKVIIFNQFKYENDHLEARDGTEKDVGNLCNEISKLRFETRSYENMKRQDILNKLNKLANKDYSGYGCVIIIVLTHGGENGLLHAYDDAFYTSDVWKPFIDCESLQDKPKIFIFQACRGSKSEKRIVITDTIADSNCYPRKKDVLISYSTVEGKASNRSAESGSWYVQSLTKELKYLNFGVDFTTLLTRVNYNVVHDFATNLSSTSSVSDSSNACELGQTPTFVSTLTKPVSLEGLISDVGEVEYAMWQEKKDALILHDAAHAPHTARIQKTLSALNFSSQTKQVSSENDVEEYVTETARNVKKGKCLFIVLMCKIQNENVLLGLNPLPFSQVPMIINYDKFKNLVGCPKLIFYLDQQYRDDNATDVDLTVKSEVPKVATEHSDFLIVKSYTKEKTARIIDGLSECLNNDLVTNLTSRVGDDASIESSLRRQIIFRKETPKDVEIELLKSSCELQRTLPRPCCADYTGRIFENEKLQQLYLNGTFSDGIDVLVHGPPGVGKTELVYKFLHTSNIKRDNVIWIHSAEKQLILDSFITEIKKIEKSAKNNKVLVSNVYSIHIDTGIGKTVLVFDEVISYKDIEEYLPEQDYMKHMFIIVTSNDSTIETSRKVSLQNFSYIESKRFVERSIEDVYLSTKVCTELKYIHGNIPAILSNLCKSITTDQVVKDAVQIQGIQNKENISDLAAIQNILLATVEGYNKQIDKMFDIPIKQLDNLDDGNYARDVIQMISVIDHDDIPHSLFPQPNLEKGYKLLNKLSIIQLHSDFIVSNSILRQKIRKMYKSELQMITNNVIKTYKCKVTKDTQLFENPLFVESAKMSWNMIIQFPECIAEAALLGIAVLKQNEETIDIKNEFVLNYSKQNNLNLPDYQEKKELLTFYLKCALVCYKSKKYEVCSEYIGSLLNLTSSSPILTRAHALQIFVSAKKSNNLDLIIEFIKFFQENMKTGHELQLAKACRDASFLFDERNKAKDFGLCWQKLIEANSNKNYQNSVMKQMLKCIHYIFQLKKFSYLQDLCSAVSDQNLISTANGVLILNYKTCCLYHLAKERTKGRKAQLNKAFASWKELYDNHYTSHLDIHFDDMLECANLLDNNKNGPKLEWVFSKFKTEQKDGLMKVLQMLRQTRENAKLSKEVALRMSQRISLPQHLREPVRLFFGLIKVPGSFEYIIGLEIKHGKNALGWMQHHISLEAVTYLVQNGADVRATGGWYKRTILHEAAFQGVLDVVVYAVQQNVNVNVRDNDNRTALHHAALKGHIEVVKYLIFRGADVNLRGIIGTTALHEAAHRGSLDIVKLLVRSGADLNIKNFFGQTALDYIYIFINERAAHECLQILNT